MPYLDIVFQNIQNGGAGRIGPANSRADYTMNFPALANVCQSPVGPAGALIATVTGGVAGPGGVPAAGTAPGPGGVPAPASGGWGANITGAGGASGMFFCESSAYPYFPPSNYNANWSAVIGPAVPFPPVAVNSAVPVGPAATTPPAAPLAPNPAPPNSILNSFTPFANINILCSFLEGFPDAAPGGAVALAPVSPNWLRKSNPNCALQCIGTGDPALYGAAPPGSDRYAIYFQATNRTYNGLGNPITGLFVHTKNTGADPGTQIAALCRQFPNALVFGDLNLNIRDPLKLQSLNAAVNGTHTLLAIQQTGALGTLYYTHRVGLFWNSCLDYALVPNAFAQHVELWAYRPGPAVPVLDSNGSDHTIMMLRIFCN